MKRKIFKLCTTFLSMCLIIASMAFALFAALGFVDYSFTPVINYEIKGINAIVELDIIKAGYNIYSKTTNIVDGVADSLPTGIPSLNLPKNDEELIIRLTITNLSNYNIVTSFKNSLPSLGSNLERNIISKEGNSNFLSVGGYIIGTAKKAGTADDSDVLTCEIRYKVIDNTIPITNLSQIYTVTIEKENPNFELVEGFTYDASGVQTDYGSVLYLTEDGKKILSYKNSNKEFERAIPVYLYNCPIKNLNFDTTVLTEIEFSYGSLLETLAFTNLPATTSSAFLTKVSSIGSIYYITNTNNNKSSWNTFKIFNFNDASDSTNTVTNGSLTALAKISDLLWNLRVGTRKISLILPSGPSGVTGLGNSAFQSCSLTSIILPSGITRIGGEVFYDCSNLTSIVIPFSVTSIDSSAFSYCSNLTSIIIPSGATNIGDYAFNDCNSLINIIIPSRVISIGDYAFNDCSSLKTVYIKKTATASSPFNGTVLSGANAFGSATSGTPFNSQGFMFYFTDQSSLDNYKSAANWVTYYTANSTKFTVGNL